MRTRSEAFPCHFCTADFYREQSRDQHEKAKHPHGGRIIRRDSAPANTNHGTYTHTPNLPVVRAPVYTNANPKEHFVVDFLSLSSACKCTICGDLSAIPLTRRCPSCDPLMNSLAAIASAKARETTERAAQPTGVLASIARGVSNMVGGPNHSNLDLHARDHNRPNYDNIADFYDH